MRLIICALFLAGGILGGTFWFQRQLAQETQPIRVEPQLASAFFVPSTAPQTLQEKFAAATQTGRKIKILIVPGHEPGFGGAEYGSVNERDMAVDLADQLYAYLSQNPHYDVAFTRNKDIWNPALELYFRDHWSDIQTFVSEHKNQMQSLIAEGKISIYDDNMNHNDAPTDVAMRLYGVNKWANEQGVDLMIHIHFNDSGTRRAHSADKYSGLAIYIPEQQYSNHTASSEIAHRIYDRLTHFSPTSNLPGEDRGVVQDQTLIAIGSNNSADSASMLVEYGYIYEPQYQNQKTRALALKELALQTYLGLSDFFGESISPEHAPQSAVLPYTWNTGAQKSRTANPNVLALQTALTLEGLYPPQGKTKNECPINGVYGWCTQFALKNFQKKFSLPGDGTKLGGRTIAKLNELYGVQ